MVIGKQVPARKGHPLEGEMLQGTLDLLILQTLILGPAHGHTIAHIIEHRSEEVLQVEHGSLYPALHRLGWLWPAPPVVSAPPPGDSGPSWPWWRG